MYIYEIHIHTQTHIPYVVVNYVIIIEKDGRKNWKYTLVRSIFY